MTEGVGDGRRRRALSVVSWVVVGVVMVALAGVAVVRLFVDQTDAPTDATTVQDVADMAVTVTEDLDVVGGVDLLCAAPLDLYRMAVESTITTWQVMSGNDVPDVQAEASDVDEGAAGSFVIRISSDEDGLEQEKQNFRVFVESRAGRSCVVGVGGPKAKRPTTEFSGGGYSRVTSPPPSPRSSAPRSSAPQSGAP
ncbi:hypothetical protein [Nocardioides sp.]|uniref:hypothetical protein n=1 Tax=Nocardioides sp. TaxID=35761 RepID=UPI00271AF841|nr:hypothetical protein [Nocardioides sp.]MDO9455165.1 hypothetical protein [Nocardioides sp.]